MGSIILFLNIQNFRFSCIIFKRFRFAMNLKISFRYLITLISFFSDLRTHSQDCNKPILVFTKLTQEHIEPRELNDSLSVEIFNDFFHKLDPAGVYFTQMDIKALSGFKYKLDDEINNASCTFLKEATIRYQIKIKRTQHWIDSILKTPLDFAVKEFWYLPNPFTKKFEEAEWKLVYRLNLKLKYDVLMTMHRLFQVHDKKDLSSANFKSLAPIAQEKVKFSYLKKIDKLLNEIALKPTFVQVYFLKAIAKTFDPHSDYMTKEEMTAFEESLSSERQSFGIDLQETSFGEIKIARLVPGGPAWKSGQLHQGDLLVQLAWPGKEAIDLVDFDLDEVEELLHTAGESQGELTVIQSTGERKTVSLAKEKIENTENSVVGFLLKGNLKIGYVELPGFFMDETQSGINGCANEVAKEIIKLNKLKIDGLILDLRYNGGGSLQEAIELAGIFVDAGPMAVIQSKGNPPISMRDVSRGVAFLGPLIILVNGASASASELVSAALQDYNRAIIVGGKTFGKATGQIILPLQETSANDDFLKVTESRTYRLNQKSIQQTGVIPDFPLPDISSLYVNGESALPHSLSRKTIDKKIYFTPGSVPVLDSLRKESKARVAADEKFNNLTNLKELLLKPFPLQEQTFIKTIQTLTGYIEQLHPTDASNTLFDVSIVEKPTEHDPYSEEAIKEIKSSIYIQEAYRILTGVIKQKK